MIRALQSLALTLLFSSNSVSAEAACPDLSLVLAIDSSSSIDEMEFALQMQGYGAAFSDQEVLSTLHAVGTVDVAVVMWAGPTMPKHLRPWQRIETDAQALMLAEWFFTTPRKEKGDTEIGNALTAALDLIEQHDTCGSRRVVDVSGDGRADPGSSRGPPRKTLAFARARAESMGVTVNGLAITNSEPDLGEYYQTSLITGRNSFVMEVSSFTDFAAAILEKLKREIEIEHHVNRADHTKGSRT